MVSWPLPMALTFSLLLSTAAIEVEVIPGVLTEFLPLPTIYETFVPILLEYKLPVYSKKNMSTLTLHPEQCTSPTYKFDSTCPTSFYLPTEVDNFLNFLDEMNPRDSDISNEILEEDEGDYADGFIQMNWDNVEESIESFRNIRTITNDVAEGYLTTTIKNPAVTVYYMSRNIELFSEDNKIENIPNMLKGYHASYWQNINSRIDEALLSNALTLYQTMIFQRLLMESSRWSQAELECRQGNLIPKTIVTRGKVANALSNLAIQLSNHSYTLSIPANNLQRYFSEKLSSCVFTQDSFLVTIRVPVHSLEVQNDELRFFKVHSVPLIDPPYNNNDNESVAVCQVPTKDSSHYFHHVATGSVQRSTCKSNQLCSVQISEFSGFNNDPCISTVVSSEEREIGRDVVQNCPLICHNVKEGSSKEFPWIKHVWNQTFVLSGKSGRKWAIVRCPGEDRVIPTFDIGAALIDVPKECKILLKDTVSPLDEYESYLFPYSQFHQIIPIQWTHHDMLGRFYLENLNISLPSAVGGVSGNMIKLDNCQDESDSVSTGNALIITSLVLLTACLIICFTFLYLQVRKIKSELFYGSDHYKKFVAYKNGTVRCNLLESY